MKVQARRPNPKPKRPMRQVNWSKIPPVKCGKTVFGDIPVDSKLDFDEDELVRLFAANQTTKPGAIAKKKAEKPPSFMEAKRQNNIGILLNQLKQFSHEQLRDALLQPQEHSDMLDLERLLIPQQIVPDAEELEAISKYSGDASKLGKAEQFQACVSSVKCLRPRINLALFKLEFPERVEGVKPNIKNMLSGCSQMRQVQYPSQVQIWASTPATFERPGHRPANAHAIAVTPLPIFQPVIAPPREPSRGSALGLRGFQWRRVGSS